MVSGATTLELLDEYFPPGRNIDPHTTPGWLVWEFGDAMRGMTRAPSPRDDGLPPAYIGGWPSSNFGQVRGDLLLSSLLYNNRVLVRDPLADWFSDDQYFVEHAMASRPGHRDFSNERQNTAESRQFIATAARALRSMRPLIDSGIVELVPSANVIRRRQQEIVALTEKLATLEAFATGTYSAAFSPNDIPVEDNVRGMFVFAPGSDAEPQIATALKRGLRYFAGEHILADEFGATYAAAFDHELYVCRNGAPAMRPQARVTEALLQSQLPIFDALTPQLISTIHSDDAFAEFRRDLYTLYANAPANGSQLELSAYVADQEQVLLQPTLDATRRSIDRGVLGRVGLGLKRGGFAIASGLAADIVGGTNGLATVISAVGAAATGFIDKPAQPASRPVWTSLIKHHRTVTEQLRDVEPQPGQRTVNGWGIATDSPMSVTVTPGSIIADFLVPPSTAELPERAYQEGVYRPCWCRSGRAYKFCCERADRNWQSVR